MEAAWQQYQEPYWVQYRVDKAGLAGVVFSIEKVVDEMGWETTTAWWHSIEKAYKKGQKEGFQRQVPIG